MAMVITLISILTFVVIGEEFDEYWLDAAGYAAILDSTLNFVFFRNLLGKITQ